MLTLINPPGLKSLSGLQMHVPNPPLGLAYIAAALREAGFDCHVVDGAGEALDDIHSYPGRADFLMQGLKLEDDEGADAQADQATGRSRLPLHISRQVRSLSGVGIVQKPSTERENRTR
jgi:hypothetical protein